MTKTFAGGSARQMPYRDVASPARYEASAHLQTLRWALNISWLDASTSRR
jgi:hypothetical protein